MAVKQPDSSADIDYRAAYHEACSLIDQLKAENTAVREQLTDQERRNHLGAFFKFLPPAAAERRARRAWVDIAFGRDGYLQTTGWLESRREKAAVDNSGKPLPWLTYACVQFIGTRISREMSVFEYGSGTSTLWWAARVRAVISCEHDAAWYKKMSRVVPGNVKLIHVPDREAYAHQILSCNDRFDVVVIDGECRVECARSCVGALEPHGIIVWDNSERTEYQPGFDLLASLQFRRIDFNGLGPLNAYGWSTSIFYRTNNCLGI